MATDSIRVVRAWLFESHRESHAKSTRPLHSASAGLLRTFTLQHNHFDLRSKRAPFLLDCEVSHEKNAAPQVHVFRLPMHTPSNDGFRFAKDGAGVRLFSSSTTTRDHHWCECPSLLDSPAIDLKALSRAAHEELQNAVRALTPARQPYTVPTVADRQTARRTCDRPAAILWSRPLRCVPRPREERNRPRASM